MCFPRVPSTSSFPAPDRAAHGQADLGQRIDDMHRDLGNKIEVLTRQQAIIYSQLTIENRAAVNAISELLQRQAIAQGQMNSTVDAIRRALKFIANKSLPQVGDDIKRSLDDTYASMNRTTDLQQQLEIALPVIPLLMQYKITLGAGVYLEAVWKELLLRIRKTKPDQNGPA